MSAPERTIIELLKRSEHSYRLALELAELYGLDINKIVPDQDGNGDAQANGKKTGKNRPGRKKLRLPKRAAQLRVYLNKNGSATRGQILHDTRIPKGTVGMLLNTYCEKRPDGTWGWKGE